MKKSIAWLAIGVLMVVAMAAVTVGPSLSVLSLNGFVSGLTLIGSETNGATFNSIGAGFIVLPNTGGWAWTNSTGQRIFVGLNFDFTPTASAGISLDTFWTNGGLQVASNRFTSDSNSFAQSVTIYGMLQSNGIVQIKTNRNGGTGVVINSNSGFIILE